MLLFLLLIIHFSYEYKIYKYKTDTNQILISEKDHNDYEQIKTLEENRLIDLIIDEGITELDTFI